MDGLAYNELPSDITSLKSLLIERDRHALAGDRKIILLEAIVAKLEEEKRLDRARRFGASSEAGDHQARLFDEAEGHQDDSAAEELEPSDLIEVPAHRKRKPKRKPLPVDLPRVVVNHDLADADKVCACGGQMRIIGEKITEQLDVIPPQVYVLEHHRPTYSCARCDESIKTAPLPPQPIPKSLASPGLLA